MGWRKNESGGEGATSPPRGPISVQAVCCWCLGIRLRCGKASAHFPAHAHTHLHPRHTIRPRNAHCDGAANVGLYTSRSTVVACGHGHWSAGALGAVHGLIPTSLPNKTTWSRTKQCTVAGHRSHISTIVHACMRARVEDWGPVRSHWAAGMGTHQRSSGARWAVEARRTQPRAHGRLQDAGATIGAARTRQACRGSSRAVLA